MQDLLERALFLRVGENYGADCLAIQVAAREICFRPKLLHDQLAHFRIAMQLVRGAVRVKKRSARYLAQTFQKCRFASGDSAGDSDYHAVRPPRERLAASSRCCRSPCDWRS